MGPSVYRFVYIVRTQEGQSEKLESELQGQIAWIPIPALSLPP